MITLCKRMIDETLDMISQTTKIENNSVAISTIKRVININIYVSVGCVCC